MEIEKTPGVDRMEGESTKAVDGSTLYGNAQRDESIVHHCAAMARSIVVAGTGDLEVGQIDQLRECGNEGWDIGRGMEQRGILCDEQVGHLQGTIFWYFFSSVNMLGSLELRLVQELFLLAGLRINDRG